jgi:histidinol-phosphatase
VTLARFRAADLLVETKPDLTPVTEADRAAEIRLRAHLSRERPDDAVLGEEHGVSGGTGEAGVDARRWVIDPIDGTKGYARGIPVWATLIALEHDGAPVVGVVSAPALGARWWAASELGAFRDGTPIGVSQVAAIEDAHLAYSSLSMFDDEGIGEEFRALARRCWRTRGFGDFWSHVMVADGSVDVAIEVGGLAVWDLAAPMAVVQEAGGTFTDLDGVARVDGGNVVASNGLLHEQVLAALRSPGVR